MTGKKSGRMNAFWNAVTFGSGTILGISAVTFVQSLIGLVIGYFIVMHARNMKKEDPESTNAKLLELIGMLIMFGPIAAFITFTHDD